MPELRVHRIPFSTNVERVALAAGIKGIEVEWVEHDPADRSAIVELSGQELVPVAELYGEVVTDSVRILRRLEHEFLEPPLWPLRDDARPRAEIFLSWFNDVWKVAPNALAENPAAPDAPGHREAMGVSVGWFEKLLGGAPFLAGTRAGIEDVCAYPFLRYAVHEPDPSDGERFHAVLHEHLAPGGHPAVDAWVERIAELPQA